MLNEMNIGELIAIHEFTRMFQNLINANGKGEINYGIKGRVKGAQINHYITRRLT